MTAVDSGLRALQLLEVDGLKVDLIITDYCMPNMTGYELLKKIKESSNFKEIPVVIMSSENVLTRKNKYKFQVQFIKNKITFLNLFNFNFNLFLVCFFFHQVFGRRCKRFHYETGDNFRLQKAQGLHEERRRRSGREWDQQEKATRAV